MSALAERDFRRILILKPSSPGDILHALPTLRARRRFPSAHIAWLVASNFAELISAEPAIDEIIPFDRQGFGRMATQPRTALSFVRFLRDLRRRRFDLVLDLQGLFRSGFLARASGAATRVGFRRAREGAPLFYSHRFDPPADCQHAAERNYFLATALGCPSEPLDASLTLTPADHAAAVDLQRQAGLRPDESFALLAPATRWETKCWPAGRFGKVAAQLAERRGLRSLVVGGRGDVPLGQQAADASGGAAINLCGRSSLRSLAALVSASRVVLTGDSTPMHLAAALGRPLVALFGPTNPSRTGPYGRNTDVVRLTLDCSPCYLRRLADCPYGHACMRDLEVEAVRRAVEQRLG